MITGDDNENEGECHGCRPVRDVQPERITIMGFESGHFDKQKEVTAEFRHW